MQRRYGDWLFENIARALAFSVLAILIAIFALLVQRSEMAINQFGFDFLTGTTWSPNTEQFGAWPSIYGTIVSTVIAMVIATPLAIGIAIFLTEIAPNRLKQPAGVAIELLAAVPSVIYGMWGLFYFIPFVREYAVPGFGISILAGGVILALMIIPFTASVTRDSMNTTPDILKESAYALGATKWDVIKDVVLPYAKIGVIGSIILSLGRALGETMAVTFVMGNAVRIPLDLLEPATSIPVTLANQFNEAENDLHYSSLYFLALILFGVSFVIIAIAKFLFLKRSR